MTDKEYFQMQLRKLKNTKKNVTVSGLDTVNSINVEFF